MKKRIFSVILVIFLTVSMLPVSAYADTEPLPDHVHGDGMLFETAFTQAAVENNRDQNGYAKIRIEESGSYYLTGDVVLGKYDLLYITGNDVNVNLCLNGYIFTGRMIVEEGATLNIYDCDDYKTPHDGYVTDGLWHTEPISEEEDIPKTLYGGILYGNGKNCISVEDAKVRLFGGTIAGAFDGGASGAGVDVQSDGQLEMFDGFTIAYNTVDGGGGAGVFVGSNGSFFMHGGKIVNNSAFSHTYEEEGITVGGAGGGVGVSYEGTFMADGGIIANNYASLYGAGVYLGSAHGEEEILTCLAAGTPIMLADGTEKPIEELDCDDELTVFDHETGTLSSAGIWNLWKYVEKKNNAFVLHFTNNIDVTAVGGHCFFEKEAGKYVVLSKENVRKYIGHKFYNAKAARWETLTDVDFLREAVETYVVVSDKSLNALANGMLSNVDGIYTALANTFEMDDNLTIIPEKKAADIEAYGLWEYGPEHFPNTSGKAYEAQNLRYLGVTLGKGLLTADELKASADYRTTHADEIVRFDSDAVQSGAEAVTRPLLSMSGSGSMPENGICLGGTVQIKDNYNENDEASNLFMCGDRKIAIGDGTVVKAPESGMSVGITLATGEIDYETFSANVTPYITGACTLNADESDEEYFFADSRDQRISFVPASADPEAPARLEVTVRPHIHSWTYAATDNVITAACEDTLGECPETNLTLTLSAPRNVVYDGMEHGAVLVETVFAGYDTFPDISYLKEDAQGEYTIPVTGTPKDAGNYKAVVEVGNTPVSAGAAYTIAKKKAVLTVENADKMIGEADPEFNYSVTGLAGADEITGVSLEREAGEEVGEYVISASFDAASNPNYDVEIVNGKLEIGGHDFSLRIISPEYLCSAATCTSPAKYYYACECGEHGIETFDYGTMKSHSYIHFATQIEATLENDGLATYICAECGDKVNMVVSRLYEEEPAEKIIVTAVMQGEINTVKMDSTIVNGTAKVDEITTYMFERAFQKAVKVPQNEDGQPVEDKTDDGSEKSQSSFNDDNTLNLDFSDAEVKVNGVEFTKGTVEALSEFLNDESNEAEYLSISLPDREIILDKKVAEVVAKNMSGDSIRLVVDDTSTESLNDTQQEALAEKDVIASVDAYFVCNGKELHDFEGGEAVVGMDVKLDSTINKTHIFVYYVDEEGNFEEMVTWFDGTQLLFKTTHFSDYVIIYDENKTNATKKSVKAPYIRMSKTIGLGNKFALNVTNVSERARVTYTSSDESVATVDDNGMITAVGKGKCTIVGVIKQKGTAYKFAIAVTVKKTNRGNRQLKENECLTPDSVTPLLNIYKAVSTKKPFALNIKRLAEDATVTYTSENESIATVSEDGVITGLKKGYTGINVYIHQNGKSYQYRVYVRVSTGK